MTVYLVANVPDHHECRSRSVEPIGVCSAERKAWDLCRKLGAHGVGYSAVDVDREYPPEGEMVFVFPNCAQNEQLTPETDP